MAASPLAIRVLTARCGASCRARDSKSRQGFRRVGRARSASRKLQIRAEVRTSRSGFCTVQKVECGELTVPVSEFNVPQMSRDDCAAAAAAAFLRRVSTLSCARRLAEEPLSNKPDDSKVEATRCVRFDLDSSVIYEVVAYSEIYGLHPREFVFDKHYSMIPAAGPFGFVGIDAEDCDDADEDGACSAGCDKEDSD